MPYTEKQNKLFRAASHDPKIAERHGMTTSEAAKLASEGVKHDMQRRTIRVRFKNSIAK